jgi:hypothetical protein
MADKENKFNFEGNDWLYSSRFYRIWSNMKTRCYNNKIPDYDRYGGRGITVCDEWLKFGNFFDDMYGSYELAYMEDINISLDRIDNSKGYSKNNCKWSSKTEQANNRRSSHFVEYNGKRQTLAQWAKEIGIRCGTLNQRYFCYKWPVEKCLTYNKK